MSSLPLEFISVQESYFDFTCTIFPLTSINSPSSCQTPLELCFQPKWSCFSRRIPRALPEIPFLGIHRRRVFLMGLIRWVHRRLLPCRILSIKVRLLVTECTWPSANQSRNPKVCFTGLSGNLGTVKFALFTSINLLCWFPPYVRLSLSVFLWVLTNVNWIVLSVWGNFWFFNCLFGFDLNFVL